MSRKWFPGLKPSRSAPVGLDTGVPHPARIVPMAEWRASGEPQPRPSPLEAGGYVAVARKD